MHHSMDVASNAKMIEVLKSELISEAADVMRATLSASNRDELIDTLGGTVLLAYMLARRCGIAFEELDADVISKAQTGIADAHKLETQYHDLSRLKKHFESEKKRGFEQEQTT